MEVRGHGSLSMRLVALPISPYDYCKKIETRKLSFEVAPTNSTNNLTHNYRSSATVEKKDLNSEL